MIDKRLPHYCFNLSIGSEADVIHWVVIRGREREDRHIPINHLYYSKLKLRRKYFLRRLWVIYRRKKYITQESFGEELSSDVVSEYGE